ncbi:hypothetical protein [Streptomyces sp. ALB3]|uniref:hypothetical protein n=1 Tax=Streptomyces sp. ALB3 TaxID=3374278 RepID=UPI003797C4E3
MNRPGRVSVLLLPLVTAVLLTGCSEAGPQASPSAATQRARTPTPAPSATPSPTPATPPAPSTAAEIAEAVDHWYEFGGGTAMTSLIEETVKAGARRPTEDLAIVTVDFEDLLQALTTARLFGSVPDPRTQAAWSAALENLENGAQGVLDSASETSLFQSPAETAQMWQGWDTFDKGVKNLKAVQARLDGTFGLKPPSDPWKEEWS